MAVYRQIQTTFWQDPFIEELEPLEKYFYLYLMTNSKTKQCGCYETSMKLIKYETGLTQDQINMFFIKLDKFNKVKFDKETSEVLILNWLKHNNFSSPSIFTCIKKEMAEIKNRVYRGYVQGVLNEKDPMNRVYKINIECVDGVSQEEQKEAVA